MKLFLYGAPFFSFQGVLILLSLLTFQETKEVALSQGHEVQSLSSLIGELIVKTSIFFVSVLIFRFAVLYLYSERIPPLILRSDASPDLKKQALHNFWKLPWLCLLFWISARHLQPVLPWTVGGDVGFIVRSDALPESCYICRTLICAYSAHLFTLLYLMYRQENTGIDSANLEFMVHHMITISAVVGAVLLREEERAAIVIHTHFPADIVVNLARMLRFSKHQKTFILILFVCVLVWVWTRLYTYPFYVLFPFLREVTQQSPSVPILRKIVKGFFGMNQLMLLSLHLFWTWKILSVVWRVLTGDDQENQVHTDDVSKTEETGKKVVKTALRRKRPGT